jgi:beta-glucosidase
MHNWWPFGPTLGWVGVLVVQAEEEEVLVLRRPSSVGLRRPVGAVLLTGVLAACGLASGSVVSAGAATPVLPTLPPPTQDLGLGCPTPPASESQPWLNPASSPECRAYFVVAALPTVAEKEAALTSHATFTNMGITMPTGGDGPAGDVTGNGVAQTPAPITLGATWSAALAAAYGNELGQEARARDKSQINAPVLDLMRTWHQGRQAESFGEDPFLTGALAAAEIPAIQQNHVEDEIKHIGAYTQETGRAGDAPTAAGPYAPASFPNNEIVSLKALNELYLLPFGMASQAGASNIMCAFPDVDGVHDCDNGYFFDTMREAYDFEGAISPDFPNAQHDVAGSLNAGCDLCSQTLGGTSLASEVSAGAIPVATLNEMIYDETVASFKVGLTDDPPSGPPSNTLNVITPAINTTNQSVDDDGAVLLKNGGGILPLRAGQTSSIAVIGPSASAAPIYAESGSAYVPPAAGAQISPLQGIEAAAPSTTTVNYAQGAAPVGEQPDAAKLPVLTTSSEPTLQTQASGGSPGLTASYYGTPDWTGPAVLTDVENGVNLDGGIPNASVAPGATNGNGATIKVNGWSVAYTGVFTAPTPGTYVFSLSDGGGAKLYLNGALVDTNLDGQFGYTSQVAEHFTAGERVSIALDYTPRQAAVGIIGPFQGALEVAPTITIGPYVQLGMAGPDTATSGTVAAPDTLIATAVAAAKSSRVAVVFVGQSSGEGVDRSTLRLPGAQDELISAVAAANPNTIVVLNTGGPVLMPWLDKVKGVVEMWYPGDQFGKAAADLLLGAATPNGRLPETWPASKSQGPGQTPAQYPGVFTPNPTTPTAFNESFGEGVDIGYRWYQSHDQTPLLPFGYGLSYTRFSYGPLWLSRGSHGSYTATTTIRNTGSRPGAEVPQLYLRYPPRAGEASWNLKGFTKVYLQPGHSQTVSFPITNQMLQSYSEDREEWVVTPGRYTLAIGSSSADMRGAVSFDVVGRRRSGREGGSPPAITGI